jgi:hypothetical protein
MKKKVDYIIKSRSEPFCAKRLKTETKSMSATGRGTKRPSTLNDTYYRVIINDCLIAVGVDDVLECAASFIT